MRINHKELCRIYMYVYNIYNIYRICRIISDIIEVTKKIWATFPMLNFSRWTPTLGVSLKWNDQKRPKIAHFGIFRHIGGVGGVQKNVDLKI